VTRLLPWPRHQPPAYSPIPARALPAAMAAAVRVARDPRPALAKVLCRDYAAEAAILCGSGTQALQLGLIVAREQVGSDTVALPAFCCYDVATATVGAGSRVLLYDLDPETLAPNLDSLDRALLQGARTAVVAPLYGIPVDWGALDAVAARHGAVLVEDAAQGHGATWRGRPLGSIGSLSVLSFGRGKGWTGGSGGALLLRGKGDDGHSSAQEVAAAWRRGALSLRHELALLATVMGQTAAANPAMYALPSAVPWMGLGETWYRSPGPVTTIARTATTLLLQSREHAAREADVRRSHGAWYSERLQTRSDLHPVPLTPGAEAGYLRFPVRLPGGLGAFPDSRHARRSGIAPSYPSGLLAIEPIRSQLAGGEEAYPGAEQLARTLVTLPTHSAVTPEERENIVSLVTGGPPRRERKRGLTAGYMFL
jgi:perosamine synthetase